MDRVQSAPALPWVALGGLAVAGIELALGLRTPAPRWLTGLFVGVGAAYVVVGVAAWRQRPHNRIGALFVASGWAWLASALSVTGVIPLTAVGQVTATLPLALLFHLVHAFPVGQVTGWPSGAIVAAAYLVSTVLQAPLYLFADTPYPADPLAIVHRQDIADLFHHVQQGTGVLLVLATGYVLARRVRTYGPPQRRLLAPLFGYGVLALVFVPLTSVVLRPLLALSDDVVGEVELAVLGTVPLAFAGVLLFGGLARAGQIDELAARLASGTGVSTDLDGALHAVLGDESATVSYWSADGSRFLDPDGDPVELPAADNGQHRAALVRHGGVVVGAITYDTVLNPDRSFVDRVAHVLGLAVAQRRLTADLLASQQALQGALARLVRAADDERRRLARDLHDGLQTSLLLLAVETQRLGAGVTENAQLREAVRTLHDHIDAAAEDLRGFIEGVMPALLLERGLTAAVTDLADRVEVPVRVRADLADRLPQAVQDTAYLVISESLNNVLKHARASGVEVTMTTSGRRLTLDVRDDGVGGAVYSQQAGRVHPDGQGWNGGLVGLADRLTALGGRLAVTSPTGGGTTVHAECPY